MSGKATKESSQGRRAVGAAEFGKVEGELHRETTHAIAEGARRSPKPTGDLAGRSANKRGELDAAMDSWAHGQGPGSGPGTEP